MKATKTISIDVEVLKVAEEKIKNFSQWVENQLIKEFNLDKFKNGDQIVDDKFKE